MKAGTLFGRTMTCVLLFVCGQGAFAATFNIPDGDVAALKDAINTANANNENDTIELASGGVYAPLSVDNSTFGPTGLPVVTSDNNHSLAINGHNAKLQGKAGQRILAGNAAQLIVNGVNFVGGGVSGPGVQGQGGAVYMTSGKLELSQSAFMDTVARQGGAIYANGGVLTIDTVSFNSQRGEEGGSIFSYFAMTTIRDCEWAGGFHGNLASKGALIASFGSATIERCILAEGIASEAGGAIWNGNPGPGFAFLTVRNCTVSFNLSQVQGGAIFNEGRLELIGSTVERNEAPTGGAIYDASTSAGLLKVSRCAFLDNVADRGGAMAKFEGADNTVGPATLTNNTLNGNGVYLGQGPVFYLSGTLSNSTPGLVTLVHNTVNTVFNNNSSGAIHVTGAGVGLSLTNNIFQRAGGMAPMFYTANSGSITSQGHNISNEAAGGDNDGTGPGGFLNAPGDMRNTNPFFRTENPEDNGGGTKTFAIWYFSPAVDQAKALGVKTDQRGHGRPEDRADVTNAAGGDGADIGAYEHGGGIAQTGPSLLVTVIDDRDDALLPEGEFQSCSTGDCTLREAIRWANELSGDNTITFAPGVEGTIELRSALPALTTNIALLGPGADRITVRRFLGSPYRIFTISNGTSTGPIVTISGLTIAQGSAFGDVHPSNSGGGILNDHGNLTLRGCALVGNQAASFGGGLFSEGAGSTAPLLIENCTFSGNSAVNSGGAVINSVAVATVSNCTFSGNTAGNFGGGVYSLGGFSGSATLTMRNCTVAGNAANSGGGVVNGFGGNLNLANNILSANTPTNLHSVGNTPVSQGHNLSSDGAGGYLTGPGDMTNTDPKLDPAGLQENGGATFTVALQSDSPAINAGDDALAPMRDQRGYLRNGASDIGAFEFGGIAVRIISIMRSGSDIVVTFDAIGGRTFRLERRSELNQGTWEHIFGVDDLTPMNNGPAQIIDTSGPLSLGKAFYRVRLLP